MKRGQTATEYLVILAIIVVIAVIVIGVLSNSLTIAGGASTRTEQLTQQTQSIVFESNLQTDTITISNRNPYAIRVSAITVGSTTCQITPKIIRIGETTNLNCNPSGPIS